METKETNKLTVKYDNELNSVAFHRLNAKELDLFFTFCAKLKEKGTRKLFFTFSELKKIIQFEPTSKQRFGVILRNQDSFELSTNTPRLSFSLVNPLYFPFPKSFINTPLESINQDSYSEFILTLTIAFLLFKGIKLIISLSNFFKKIPLESINQDSFPTITLKSSENRKRRNKKFRIYEII